MGTKYLFKCNTCDYTAELSGGKDVGMLAMVQTMTCENCNELVDVLIGRYGKEGKTEDAEFNKALGICPECKRSDVVQWDDEKPCPKCDGKMIRGEETMLWD